MKKKAVLLDISAIMYRAYFSLQNMKNSKGVANGAVYGFINSFFSIIDQLKPDYIYGCFDVKRSELKRREIFPDYKIKRDSMPDDLATQIPLIHEFLKLYNISCFKKIGYEADDLLGTISQKMNEQDILSYIVTGDKDLAQLLNENIKIALLTHKSQKLKILNTREDVYEKLGVFPEEITDFFGLKGDASDGIPGVNGVGDKTASKLISDYKNLDNLYLNIENISGKLKEKLLKDKEIAYMSKKLAKIHIDIPLEIETKEINLNHKIVYDFYKKLEFHTIIKKLKIEKTSEIKVNKKIDLKIKLINKIDNLIIDKYCALVIDESGLALFDGKSSYFIPKEFLEKNKTQIEKKLSDIKLYFYNTKKMLKEIDINLNQNNIYDILILHHLLYQDSNYKLSTLLLKYFDYEKSEKLQKTLFYNPIKENCEIAYYIFQLGKKIHQQTIEENLIDIYENIEKKIVVTLIQMEKNGILIDPNHFEKVSTDINIKLKEIKEKIFSTANEEFNINSPKQLGVILFEKLNIPIEKKIKTGYSTDRKVLSKLKQDGYQIAEFLINYRELNKLKTTYLDVLPNLSDHNNRIHTTFKQVGTNTGRFSSVDPNLQNIPTKTKTGKKIREGFISKPNYQLLSLDYSQIELRILAELSKDHSLISAYKNNLDLHLETAKILFEKEEISSDERNIAKTINFSVIYGKTSYGLSKELNIGVKDAKKYIAKFFDKYPNVKKFMDEILIFAKKNGYVKTYFNRKRIVPDILNQNKTIRQHGERAAINAVIQGTAADIIKLAMIKIYDKIKNKDDIKMLLQIHDELIFEVRDTSIDGYNNLIKDIMENIVDFKCVQLKVNSVSGSNWGVLK